MTPFPVFSLSRRNNPQCLLHKNCVIVLKIDGTFFLCGTLTTISNTRKEPNVQKKKNREADAQSVGLPRIFIRVIWMLLVTSILPTIVVSLFSLWKGIPFSYSSSPFIQSEMFGFLWIAGTVVLFFGGIGLFATLAQLHDRYPQGKEFFLYKSLWHNVLHYGFGTITEHGEGSTHTIHFPVWRGKKKKLL